MVLWFVGWVFACFSALAAPGDEAATEGNDEGVARELVVAVSPFAPFVSLEGEGDPLGFSVDLWRALAREEGLTYRFARYANVTEKLEAVREGEADVAIGGISLTREREQTVDFTQATFRTGLDILAPDVRHSPFSFAALRAAATPGRVGIIVGFFLLIVVSGHLVWLAERGKEEFDDRYIPGVFEGMYWAIVTASTVGYGDKAPVRWTGRLVAACVIVVSLPMFAVFTAELSSTLTVATLQSTIQSEDDLRGKAVGVVEGTTGARTMEIVGAKVFGYPNAASATDALLAGEVVAVVHDAPNLHTLVQERSEHDLMVVGNLFQPQHYGFVVAQGSPNREALDRALLSVQESGEWGNIRARWFEGDLGE